MTCILIFLPLGGLPHMGLLRTLLGGSHLGTHHSRRNLRLIRLRLIGLPTLRVLLRRQGLTPLWETLTLRL